MDCRLQGRIRGMVEGLAREHQRELAAAGTLVDLEELTCQIGDEVARGLAEKELRRRGQERGDEPEACPDCGRLSRGAEEPEPVVLQGLRGELAYSQPKHYCSRCRRSFFPDGSSVGLAAAEHSDAEGSADGGVGRQQHR